MEKRRLVEPTQGWAQSGLLARGFGRLESSLPSRTGLVMVQSSYRIHGDLALRPSEDTKIHNVQVSSTAWPNPFISSTQSSHRLSVLSRLLTTECKANAVQMVILAHCLVKDKKYIYPYIFCSDAVSPQILSICSQWICGCVATVCTSQDNVILCRIRQ